MTWLTRPELKSLTTGLRSLARRMSPRNFRRDQSGTVAITFAITAVPLLGLIGAGVDYGRFLDVQARMNQAADASALASVSRSLNPQMNLPNADAVKTYFRSTVGELPPGVTYTVDVKPTTSVNSLFVTVSYTARVPTTVMQIVGFNFTDVSGTASAVAQFPKYIDFYLLLDNSPSMGLAATTQDITNMQTKTGGCAFACHQRKFDSKNYITGDSTSDNYTIAKNNNIKTRIDVVRTATQELTTTATKSMTLPNQFRMAVYTFSDVFQSIAALTTNLTSVQTAANAIDLAYAYRDERDTQTDFSSTLSYMDALIPAPGDGSSTSNPMKFLFIVTDGVEDKPVKSASGTGNKPDYWKNGTSGWPTGTQVNKANTTNGNVSSTRLIQTLDPALCNTFKNRGVKIAVLYTTYLPLPTNAFYNQWIKPITATIPTRLKSCASEGLFFEVTPDQGIDEAMQQMFQSALTSARLTR
ncbi:MAG: Flp pilus assembly protein TadG [Hyphomicrobiales bacterium]|nr:Flp pilus assembly protein TadG [Hyphomicrobiales bacterium]